MAGKALTWVKNITDFLRFCYLNIPCVRINITLIFMSSASDEFTRGGGGELNISLGGKVWTGPSYPDPV